MKKLIKTVYYYVIDDKANLQENDLYLSFVHGHVCDECPKICSKAISEVNWHLPMINGNVKVIATTNYNIPLPQITNANDELVNKEVEVALSYSDDTGNVAKIWLAKETSTNETLEEVAEQSYSKQIHPDTSEYECFFHYTDELLYCAGFEQGYKHCEKTMYSELLNFIDNIYIDGCGCGEADNVINEIKQFINSKK